MDEMPPPAAPPAATPGQHATNTLLVTAATALVSEGLFALHGNGLANEPWWGGLLEVTLAGGLFLLYHLLP